MSVIEKFLKNEQGQKLRYFLFGNTFLLLLSIFIFVYYKISEVFKITLCPMKTIFHSFCPFCGGSRSALSFFSLDFKTSFMYHPTTMVLMVYAIIVEIVCIIDLIFKKNYVEKIFRLEIVIAIYLIASVIQYAIRLYYHYNHLHCDFMILDL